MVDVRCECGKILCQHEAQVVIIKCRHCKRLLSLTVGEKTKTKHEQAAARYILVKPNVVNI